MSVDAVATAETAAKAIVTGWVIFSFPWWTNWQLAIKAQTSNGNYVNGGYVNNLCMTGRDCKEDLFRPSAALM
jgi:hypothetical protein